MNTAQIKLYDLFRKELKLDDDKAKEFVTAVEQIAEGEIKAGNKDAATNEFVKDEIHRLELQMYKSMFWTSLVQLLAILGGVLAIVKFIKP